MSDTEFDIASGTLTVNRDLRQDFDLSFDQACSDLLESEEDSLTINLSQVTYINSTYIGMIAATYFQAQSTGKSLCIIAPESVLHVLRAAGFDGFIELVSSE